MNKDIVTNLKPHEHQAFKAVCEKARFIRIETWAHDTMVGCAVQFVDGRRHAVKRELWGGLSDDERASFLKEAALRLNAWHKEQTS